MQTNIHTASAEDLIAAASSFHKQGKLAEAIQLANEVIRRFSSNPDGWMLLSQINLQRGATKDAVDNIQKAISLNPQGAKYYAQLARCFTLAQQKHLALEAAKRAAELKPEDAESLDAVAAILTLCDEQDMARPLAEQAVALAPENAFYRYNLAALQRMLGDTEAAEENCDKAIALNPDDYRAYFTRSDLRKQNDEDNHIEEIEALLQKGAKNWRGEMMLNFALAKEYDDIAAHDESFPSLKLACDLHRQHIDYDVKDDVDAIEHIIATHSKDAFSASATGFESEEPIFVVGLPRSGTTLVERILNSHSQVFAAGELQDFAAVLVQAVQGSGGKQTMSKKEMIEAVLNLDFSALGNAYIESTRPRTGHSARFIDKLPLNYLYCGLINAALPRAKIIVLKRHPMDSCYAMYKAMFQSAYPFSYDLTELGQYYTAWSRLIDHWQEDLGDALMTIHYEDLVNEQENISRELLGFCGLEWEDACLEFYKSDSASSTASAVQVRQPMYKSSLGKWKLYEKHLGPLRELFEKNGIAIE